MSDILRILIAPLVWLAGFSLVYGLNGVLCSDGLGDDASTSRAILLGAYGLLLALQATILVGLHLPRFASPSGFTRFVSRATGWVGLVAAAWSLMPVLTLSICR